MYLVSSELDELAEALINMSRKKKKNVKIILSPLSFIFFEDYILKGHFNY